MVCLKEKPNSASHEYCLSFCVQLHSCKTTRLQSPSHISGCFLFISCSAFRGHDHHSIVSGAVLESLLQIHCLPGANGQYSAWVCASLSGTPAMIGSDLVDNHISPSLVTTRSRRTRGKYILVPSVFTVSVQHFPCSYFNFQKQEKQHDIYIVILAR